MHESTVTGLRQQAEPLVALSSAHLTTVTRRKLSSNDLSVNCYPTADGGVVYVGSPRYDIPTEADLAAVFEMAELAGVVWLKFDPQAAIIDGLPVFDDPGETW